MSNLALIAVLLRVAGIWLLWLHGFRTLSLVVQGVSGLEGSLFLLILTQSSGSVVLGLALLIWPITLARMLVPRSLREEEAKRWMPVDIGAVALGVTGIVFIATTLGSGSAWNAVFIYFEVQEPAFRRVHSSEVLGHVVRLVIGFVLLFGAVGISRVLSFGRRARFDNDLP